MKKLLLSVCMLFSASYIFAQTGDISGKVKDEKGEGIPFATVTVVQNNNIIKGVQTDFDGNYTLKPLSPGKYDVKFSYIGYQPQLRTGVVVSAEKSTYLDIQMKPSEDVLAEVEIVEYKVPLIDAGKTTSGNTISQEDIARLPTRDLQSIASTTSGAFQADEGGGINIKGGREDATAIYIDGVRVRGKANIPASAISQLTVITGGVPAKYGDQTGGAISVTTRGPSSQFNGGLELVSSEFMDAYGYNLVSANLTGPIYTNKKTNRTIAGFFLSGEFERFRDNDPSAVGIWKVKDEKYKEIQQTPLIKNPVQEGYLYAAEALTRNDLELIKSRPNVADNQYRGVGKLDFRLSEAINITLGATYNYQRYHNWIDRYTLLNYENNPLFTNQTYRGYIRFTHNIGQGGNKDEEKTEKKSSAFQNAYYTIQVDYEKFLNRYGDDTHFENYFDYGYIGKFDVYRKPTYDFTTSRKVIDANGNERILTGWQQTGDRSDSVSFTSSDINELGSRFTSVYMDLVKDFAPAGLYDNLFSIQSNRGLLNGTRSLLSHNIWFNSGRQYNGSGRVNNDQYTVKLDGAFDILKPGSDTRNKHSIEFGFQFEQRQERMYSVSPLELWTLMRLLANSHIQEFDVNNTNPLVKINGEVYEYNDPNRPSFGFNDTILAPRIIKLENQSGFDRNLRIKLGLDPNGSDFINTDALTPDVFSLNMFTADELISPNLGGSYVNYFGYDYLGRKLNGKTAFNDFFTKKDENGNLKREIGAFQPIYIAGYIQDKFQFKDLTFNVGLRVDRYDANQKVMRDPYSLFQIQTAEEFVAKYTSFTRPSNIGENYAVYVDDNLSNTPSVVGYRNGDLWYDAQGNALSSGNQLANASSNGKIQPMFTDPNVAIAKEGALIRDPDKFNPEGSFVDYKPQVNIMPRLQFSFSLTDKALFYAHYDVLTQRPQSAISNGAIAEPRNFSDPYQFLWWDVLSNGALMNNPNLKPEKTIDFQLGFRQKVSNTSAISIQAFYREFKDQVQIIMRRNTYPGVSQQYLTLGNVDFGTTKGFNIDYDLRRTGNLMMKLNYTLQFAEGTGSDNQTQLSAIQSGAPNFRTITPLSYDARHMFNATIDYRYGSGSDYNGPYIGKHQIFSNAGINFVFSARSGTPYTKQETATPNGLSGVPNRPITLGSINGARIPWFFRLNVRVNKDFNVKVGKKQEGKDQRELNFSVYFLFQNILNTKNVTKVYRFTGNPSDDGYLGSSVGQLDVNSKAYPDSYKDLYRAFINSPDNYAKPRNIRLGLSIGF